MMLATILLIINFAFLLLKDEALINFWNFLWIYPLEFGLYFLLVWVVKTLEKW